MSQRNQRLSEEIRRELSDIIQREVKDPRLGFLSITTVELSRDFSHAKVFVSVYGDEQERNKTLEGLTKAAGFIRTELGKRIRIRHTPELAFIYDDSLEHGARISAILKELDTGGTDQ
ncbi:MAG: 30S ribosome-binding factor RbfA [Firmicutes bacterium]|nr:30S ribosome-binding factor RbfA [Bacillota bacterium]